MHNSTLENTQQLMKLISGPTGEEKDGKETKMLGEFYPSPHSGCTGTDPKLSVTVFTAPVKKQMCLLFEALSGELMSKLFSFNACTLQS